MFRDDDVDTAITASEVDISISSDKDEDDMETSDREDADAPLKYGPETREECTTRLLTKVKNKFKSMNNVGKESALYPTQVQKVRAIVDVQKILQLFQKCQLAACSANCNVKEYSVEGGVVKVEWVCANLHHGFWLSSEVLCEKSNQNVFVNTVLLSAAVLLTGNNFEKVALFCKFLGIDFLSSSTYYRIQRHYVVPECLSFWDEMKTEIWSVLNGEAIILCGDGRNDSPGHCAKYCTYVLMEQFLNVIVDLEVVDKRETGGVSTNMEVFGLRKLLERVVAKLVVSEIVTDASTAVIALVRKMKGKNME